MRHLNHFLDTQLKVYILYLYLAVIVETYGSGNMPRDRPGILQTLKEANERGVIIINVSQCRKGLVQTSYECGHILQTLGVIFAGDMTVECAMAKLSYLLGKEYPIPKIKEEFVRNIRGEITPQVEEAYSPMGKQLSEIILGLMNKDQEIQSEISSKVFMDNLMPTIINKLVELGNLKMLKKFKTEISMLNFSSTYHNPLHIAAKNGKYDIAKFLVNKCHLDINQLDGHEYTSLYYACYNNHKAVALMLKEKGGIINEVMLMASYFCSLVCSNDLDKIKLFYECGANIMQADYDKRTIAHIAVAENKLDIIKFLIEHTNYEFKVKDRYDRMPFDGATQDILDLYNKKTEIK